MLEGILGFFDKRVFGPRRRDLLEQDLATLDGEPERKRERRVRSLRRAIEKLHLSQARLVRKLESDDDPLPARAGAPVRTGARPDPTSSMS